MHFLQESKQKSKQIINSHRFGKHVELHKNKGHDQLCTCWNRHFKRWQSRNSKMVANSNVNHIIKLWGDAIWRTRSRPRSRPASSPRDRGLPSGGARAGRGGALALQLLPLGQPGAAGRALRAGVGRGAQHLLEAAAAVVRPAYFRLKRAERNTCS